MIVRKGRTPGPTTHLWPRYPTPRSVFDCVRWEPDPLPVFGSREDIRQRILYGSSLSRLPK